MKIKFNYVLLAFIFLYPITPWYIAFGPLNLVNIVALIFVVLWAFGTKIQLVSLSKTSAFFWIYLVVYSMQAVFDTSITNAFAYIIAQLVVCLIFYSEVRKRNLLKESLQTLAYAGGFLAITGLVEEITRVNIFHIISRLPENNFYKEIRLGIYRIETSFSHPIVYCAYLCFIAGILVYLIEHEESFKKKRLFKVIYIIVLVNAVLTMSRSTLLILNFEQFILGYYTGFIRFSKKIIIGIVLLIVFVVVSLAVNLSFISRLRDVWYMILAIFDDSYSSLYTASFGMNQSGVGNRLDLFNWVAESVKGHELFGMGTSSKFAYSVHAIESTWNYAYTWTKTSIENEYLYNYYIHGAVGLLAFTSNIISTILYSVKTNSKRKNVYFESKKHEISFPKLMTILLLGYAIMLFSVRASDNVRIFNLLICMLFAYRYNLKEWSSKE